MKRVVLCVEGEGDVQAAPVLVSRLWTGLPDATQVGFIDPRQLRVGNITRLTGRHAANWPRYLRNASERGNLGAVLLLQDADVLEDQHVCVMDAARALAEAAREAGGGSSYSAAVVFFRQEYESLLIASYPFLTGHRDGVEIPRNVEEAPRGAEGWLKKNLEGGYRKTVDQIALTRQINIDHLRGQPIRSFQRLESAVRQLAEAIVTGNHVVTPARPIT